MTRRGFLFAGAWRADCLVKGSIDDCVCKGILDDEGLYGR